MLGGPLRTRTKSYSSEGPLSRAQSELMVRMRGTYASPVDTHAQALRAGLAAIDSGQGGAEEARMQ
eukprot:1834654-Pyramimonas_sp.AAC.1